jgi:hypothetical protein
VRVGRDGMKEGRGEAAGVEGGDGRGNGRR